MKILYYHDYEEMSQASAVLMADTLKHKKDANICLASGGSPERTYELFVEKLKDMEYSEMVITKLDEWCGVASDSPLSCERYLHERVLDPLHIRNKNYISFQPDAEDFTKECQKVHEALENKPLDLCVLGLGRNGHLGLNEPHSFLQPYAHVAELSELTKGHAMIKGSALDHGITIGMQEIMASKKILLQVSGEEKEAMFDGFLTMKIDPLLPASFLWLHPNVEVHVREDQFPKR